MTMQQTLHDHLTRTALVLGGGGSAGNAWLIGVVAGLAENGVPVHHADLLVGTSAGATAAAQLCGADPAELLRQVLETPVPAARPARPGAAGGRGPTTDHLARTQALIDAAADPADMRRRIGTDALELADADPGLRDRWRSIVGSRLPVQDWPARRVFITAVDATTGDPVVLDAGSGIDLVDAVAASTSGAAAYRAGGTAYVDGGYRTNADNADLAAGYDQVLVLSPLGGRTRLPLAWGLHLDAQAATLREAGSEVTVILPDADALAAFGDNLMDPSTRPPAARAGHAQGLAAAPGLRRAWSD
jgi:NTE family protein